MVFLKIGPFFDPIKNIQTKHIVWKVLQWAIKCTFYFWNPFLLTQVISSQKFNITVRIKYINVCMHAWYINVCVSSSVEVSDCGRYVVLYVSRGAEPRNKLYYSDLDELPGRQISGLSLYLNWHCIHTCMPHCMYTVHHHDMYSFVLHLYCVLYWLN